MKSKLFPLDKRIKGFAEGYRQNIALLGNDEEELSYLLEDYITHHTLQELICIHARISYGSRRDIFKNIVISVLTGYTQKSGLLDTLINYSAELLPVTTGFIKETLKREEISFLDILEVINKFINETRKKCIFIIEEFLKIRKVFATDFKHFSKFIILQRNCMVVLTSSRSKESQKVLATELHLLFGNFEKVLLEERSFFDNYLYLKNSLRPLSPSPFFLSFFINIIGNNILYYDVVAEMIRVDYRPDNEEESLVTILDKTFYQRETYYFQKFLARIEFLKEKFRDYRLIIKILRSLSEGYLRKKELVSLNICKQKELAKKLSRLAEINYIENIGDLYKIKDNLFSFWISSAFTFHFLSPFFSASEQKKQWRIFIQETIALFKEDFYKSTLNKVLELITSFKDDTLRCGRKRYKLPSITRSKVITYPEKDFSILIGEGKEIIFAGIKERGVSESDVLDFIERGKGIKSNKVKKIFISLERLSPTAQLIAKNHKLLVWDIDEINYLLRAYHKPIISFAYGAAERSVLKPT